MTTSGGRPPTDPRTAAQVVVDYTTLNGDTYHHITKIGDKHTLSRATVRKILKEAKVYVEQDEIEEERDAARADLTSPPGHNPIVPPPAPQTPAEEKLTSEAAYAESIARIGEYGAGVDDFSKSDIGKLVDDLEKNQKFFNQGKRKLARLLNMEGDAQNPDAPLPIEGDSQNVHQTLEAQAEAAKELLTRMGHKVIEGVGAVNEEVAVKLLEGIGYQISGGPLSWDTFQEELQKEKKKWDDTHQEILDRATEDTKIKAAENIVTSAVNKMFDLFMPFMQKTFGDSAEKSIQSHKKTRGTLNRLRDTPSTDPKRKQRPPQRPPGKEAPTKGE